MRAGEIIEAIDANGIVPLPHMPNGVVGCMIYRDAPLPSLVKLRDDVQWTDGRKVRAQDFEYSWKRLLDPKTASQYAYILFDIVNAADYAQGGAYASEHVLARLMQQARRIARDTAGVRHLGIAYHHSRLRLSAALSA